MPPVTKELEAVLLALPRAERARLAEWLIASLDEDSEVEHAWDAEVKRRLDGYRDGEVEAVTAAAVHDEARRRMKR